MTVGADDEQATNAGAVGRGTLPRSLTGRKQPDYYQRMRGRDVEIPRPLRELHGERSTLFDLLLVYGAGAAFGVLALVFAWSRVADLPWWKSILLFIVAADASGGAVANFSASTDRYYSERPGLRWAFILVHVIPPAVLYVLFGGPVAWWILLYVYTVAAAAVVNVVQEKDRQETAAAAFLVLGIVITLPFGLRMPFLAWFAPVSMIKLILAFAVRRS